MKLSPEEFWSMGLIDFLDVANALVNAEEEQWDKEYQRTAWQTSLLMNATGNYSKKKITADMLYKSPYAEKEVSSSKRKDKQYVESEQNKLKEMFGL